jgi:hypothetical protein
MLEIYARTFMTATRTDAPVHLGLPLIRSRGWLRRALTWWGKRRD